MKTYKDLDVWKAAMLLIQEVYTITNHYPKEETYGLMGQSRRAAVSIAANIAEANGRQYKKDALQFLHIARGSLYELDTLVQVAFQIGILPKEKLEDTTIKLDTTLKLLNGFIRYMESADLK